MIKKLITCTEHSKNTLKIMLNTDLDYILKNTTNEVANFSQKKILITGGTGFFGTNLLNTFKYMINNTEISFTVDVICRNPDKFSMNHPELYHFDSFKFIKQDISHPFKLHSSYDYIIHAATSASKNINDHSFDKMAQTIIDGTINTLNAIQNKGSKFLYISSGGIYGDNISKKKTKEHDLNSINPMSGHYSYHLSKLCAENLCFSYANKFDINIKIARCFAFVGPHLPLDEHFAIGNFINSALNNDKITIKSEGKSVRSFLYASDLVIWLIKILCQGNNLQPYNVGSSEEITIADLAKKIGDLKSIPIEIEGNSEKDTFYVPNVDLTMSDLDIQNFIDLDSAIEKTIEWYESK
jgi:nucleoside-diphosphate-sugar epimerase